MFSQEGADGIEKQRLGHEGIRNLSSGLLRVRCLWGIVAVLGLLLFLLILALLLHGLCHQLLKGHVITFLLGVTLGLG